jgi:hypothetical protein
MQHLTIDGRDAKDVVLWQTRPEKVTAKKMGTELAGGHADDQAATFAAMAADIDGWAPGQSWSLQCRFIARRLTDDGCRVVASMLEVLVEHLRAIPKERAEKRLAARRSSGQEGGGA